MKSSKRAETKTSTVPYHRLLSLRGQIDEIDAALRCSERPLSASKRYALPPVALIASRKAVEAELEVAEHQWRTSRPWAGARAA